MCLLRNAHDVAGTGIFKSTKLFIRTPHAENARAWRGDFTDTMRAHAAPAPTTASGRLHSLTVALPSSPSTCMRGSRLSDLTITKINCATPSRRIASERKARTTRRCSFSILRKRHVSRVRARAAQNERTYARNGQSATYIYL